MKKYKVMQRMIFFIVELFAYVQRFVFYIKLSSGRLDMWCKNSEDTTSYIQML